MTDAPRAARSRFARTALVLTLAAAALAPAVAAAQKPPLDHDAYDLWRTIRGERISADGEWVLYHLVPRVGDAELVVTRRGSEEVRVERARGARFSPDGRFAVFTITPAHDSVRTLRLKETPRRDLPPDTLGILSLASGEVARVAAVRSWQMPERGAAVVAYLTDPATPADTTAVEEDPVVEEPVVEEPVVGEPGIGEPVVGEPGIGEPVAEEPETDDARSRRKTPETRTLVVRELATGAEHRYEGVVEIVLAEAGAALAYTGASEDGSGGGVWRVELTTGAATPVLTGAGSYKQPAISEDGRRVAVLSDRDEPEADEPAYALFAWREGEAAARRVAAEGSAGIPAGWWVSADGALSFSESGRRLFFGTAPRPEPARSDTLLAEERVRLDVWHWSEDLIQPMQLRNADDERTRTYRAVVHLDRRDRIVQLATESMPSVSVGGPGQDGAVALAETNVAYRTLVGVEAPGFSDLWLIDVADGSRRRLVENRQVWRAALSPESRYAAWYDFADRQWHIAGTGGGEAVRTDGIPHPVWNEDDDRPMHPTPYGAAGWTAGDRAFLVYDRYDIWAVDPAGRAAPRNATAGAGREQSLQLRYVDLDPDEPAIPADGTVLLSAFHTATKEAGFFRGRLTGAPPERLVLAPKRYNRPVRAESGGAVLFTREDVAEFPDLWVAGPWLESPVRVSDANPQQAEYNWATVELVEWTSTDGVPLQGLLYRPEDFDPSRAYPMVVNFYERSSDNLYQHVPPLPHRSVVRPTFYASRGYVVFMPDIVYQEGYPGKSAMDAVMPGTLKLAAEPWVDRDRIGVQGHSWGGYQIAHMVTRTNVFRAAGAGAPVANMTSAYGGIRWETGMSRMFQYERTQSRIGGSLWDRMPRYIENSPLFYLDRVETPVLIMHNDEDGAVPFEQGIELFMGLRRLGKPAWLINYNEQPHWPVTAANIRDWNIRLQQFFDHFLKDAPAPEWLRTGIPATAKGRTLGLELVEETPAEPAGREGVAGSDGR